MAAEAEASATAASAGAAVAADVAAEFAPFVTALGEAWASELVRMLRANKRRVLGAWPGTLSEARVRVLAVLHRKLDLALLDDLARATLLAARREWHQVSQPDPES